MTYVPVYRDGKLHVLEDKCASCIFRNVNDGRIMGLNPGRVGKMVEDARADGSVIPCHNTLYEDDVQPAVCRGYYDRQKNNVAALALAEAMDIIVLDPVPEK